MKRSEQRKEDTWDLESVYSCPEDWQADCKALEADLAALASHQGKIVDGDSLYSALCDLQASELRLEKIYTYASLGYECDGLDSEAQRREGVAVSLCSRLAQSASYLEPEIMALDEAKLRSWIQEERFSGFRVYLIRLVRQRAHTLTAAEERIMALEGETADCCQEVFDELTDVDFDFGQVGDVKLTHASFSSLMRSPDETVRREAYLKLYGQYEKHSHTLARLYSGSVRQDIFQARARHYSSSLEAALFPDDVDQSVYHTLIESVESSLDSLHRYYELKRRRLGLESLHHYDVYVPMTRAPEVDYPYDKAVGMIASALGVLGKDYVDTLVRGLTEDRWVDRYENEGKRSGAFSAGSYTSKPFILTNYRSDSLSSVFTLAHEGGHSMHSLYSARNNPFMASNYSIFEAEVASTFNEELLSRHLIAKADTKALKAHLIATRLDDIVATLFRQTMFAHYELTVHEEVEKGGVATLDYQRKTYRSLLEAYFGPDVELIEVSDLEALRIPHFYNAFYVYKYATGLSAALALADRVMDGGVKERDDYLAFLASGGSRWPIESLRLAGVDMADSGPVKAAIAHFNRLMDEYEALD
ncbi:MAG: oligoendopeptidase F [Spirochaetes bacterium]|uniref:Oligopeptidase F n=1 Tax=Candidatus Aphodenecus pullistercoris TaxID=2840669 RepID=A0A9D9ECY6_9SPIR|nr:oligoendopeptidase F [Candidatus Aphodenecus pullistercoris]